MGICTVLGKPLSYVESPQGITGLERWELQLLPLKLPALVVFALEVSTCICARVLANVVITKLAATSIWMDIQRTYSDIRAVCHKILGEFSVFRTALSVIC